MLEKTTYYKDRVLYDLELGPSCGRSERKKTYLQFAHEAGEPLLELGCGTGNILSEVAKQGFLIYGVDNCREMLNGCREKIKQNNLQKHAKIFLRDTTKFSFPLKFKAVFMPYHVCFHLLKNEDFKATLRNIYNHLEENGLLVLDIFALNFSSSWHIAGELLCFSKTLISVKRILYKNKEYTVETFKDASYNTKSNIYISHFTHRFHGLNREIIKRERTLTYRIYTPDHLNLLFSLMGFKDIKIIPFLEPKFNNYLITAKKKAAGEMLNSI